MAGYSVIGCKRKVTSSSVLAFIVESSKEDLERKLFPEERRATSPPFTFVGVDTFGLCNVVAGNPEKMNSNIQMSCV